MVKKREIDKLNDFQAKSVVKSIALSPGGQYVVTGNSDGSCRLWNLKGKLLNILKEHKAPVTSVIFSKDGRYIVSCSEDRTVRLWTLQGYEMMVYRGHQNKVNSVAISPDGRYIVSGSEDATVRVWVGDNWETWLQVACEHLCSHPILKEPETEVARQACEICQKHSCKEAENAL